ncbi:hypothetical protein [Thiothrix subterranea]|uniref:Uncharacterized protein n=1 Tax=Thiothrix subterranea TaxID=2735563 RepID=A0AA51MT00_9GAMM|nr:hypothetical protein [Thiothrix subterranea]MDQ5767241.1 hypothetical protein [Thiothrix subterranea]WML87902.1 hypothetical protein RCG00_05910 [Thiothrix subterranea]
MNDHNENINLDDINIDDIIKNNQSEWNEMEDDIGSDIFNETHATSDEEEITFDDSSIIRLKEEHENNQRMREDLRVKYSNLHKICQQKKQEIQAIKNIVFSSDCKNDKEAIFNSIETETCKSIKGHAFHISQNIRTNPLMAKISLDNLKRDTELLTLQFDYTSTIEQLFAIHADYNKLKNKCDAAEPKILGLMQYRDERIRQAREQARLDKKIYNEIKEAEDIMNQY